MGRIWRYKPLSSLLVWDLSGLSALVYAHIFSLFVEIDCTCKILGLGSLAFSLPFVSIGEILALLAEFLLPFLPFGGVQ